MSLLQDKPVFKVPELPKIKPPQAKLQEALQAAGKVYSNPKKNMKLVAKSTPRDVQIKTEAGLKTKPQPSLSQIDIDLETNQPNQSADLLKCKTTHEVNWRPFVLAYIAFMIIIIFC